MATPDPFRPWTAGSQDATSARAPVSSCTMPAGRSPLASAGEKRGAERNTSSVRPSGCKETMVVQGFQ